MALSNFVGWRIRVIRHQAATMDKPTLDAMFREVHRAIREAAEVTVRQLRDKTPELNYPPNATLSAAEREALAALTLSPAACSALTKLIADAANYPLFHLFSLIDGVTDPADAPGWRGLHLGVGMREPEPMLHDELYESYWASAAPADDA
jgi:hypothetical protein